MFSGIITEVGSIKKRSAHELNIAANASFLRRLKTGDSVSVNGACLTVANNNRRILKVEVMLETWQRTMLGKLGVGQKVNLELPIKTSSLISGHFVQGHVDGTAKVKEIKKIRGSRVITFKAPKELLKYIVEKGSVSIQGVSLTATRAGKADFSVGIIPHTLKVTTLGQMKEGDLVNVEVDILAKYIEKLAKK